MGHPWTSRIPEVHGLAQGTLDIITNQEVLGQPHTSAESGWPPGGGEGKGGGGREMCRRLGMGKDWPISGLSTPEIARFLFVLSTFKSFATVRSAGAEGKRRRDVGVTGEVESSARGRGGRRR